MRDQVKVEADVSDRHVDIVEVRPPWNGVGERTRFPIARLRYTKSTGLWAIYWRDRNLKFHEYKRKRPAKNVKALLDHIGTGGDPTLTPSQCASMPLDPGCQPSPAATTPSPQRQLAQYCSARGRWYFGTREGGSAMATATAPIKVDAATDELVSHAAHFMSRSKKDIVDAAVREYIDAHRDEINAGIKAALGQLNGTDAPAVSLMTGLSCEELDDLGGMPK